MDIHAILIRSPVNKTTRNVVSQRGASDEEKHLDRSELVSIVERLKRKQRLLKRVLKITNESQHKNLKRKSNKGINQFRFDKEPRSFIEYRILGLQIKQLNDELALMRKARKLANEQRLLSHSISS